MFATLSALIVSAYFTNAVCAQLRGLWNEEASMGGRWLYSDGSKTTAAIKRTHTREDLAEALEIFKQTRTVGHKNGVYVGTISLKFLNLGIYSLERALNG